VRWFVSLLSGIGLEGNNNDTNQNNVAQRRVHVLEEPLWKVGSKGGSRSRAHFALICCKLGLYSWTMDPQFEGWTFHSMYGVI
jgi:hypothetical protein